MGWFTSKAEAEVASTVWAWGDNEFGQIGDGTFEERLAPVRIAVPGDVTAIDAGLKFVQALRTDGTVWGWGYNFNGELGDGTTSNRSTPSKIDGLDNVVAVAAGWYSTYALKSDGTVWAWGANNYAQLGDETQTPRLKPERIVGLVDVIAVAAGEFQAYAIRADGRVWAWGQNRMGQCGIGGRTMIAKPEEVGKGRVETNSGANYESRGLSDFEEATGGSSRSQQATCLATRWVAPVSFCRGEETRLGNSATVRGSRSTTHGWKWSTALLRLRGFGICRL